MWDAEVAIHDNQFSPVMATGAPRGRRCRKCSANFSARFRHCPKCGKAVRSGRPIAYAVFCLAFLAVAVVYGIVR